MAVFRDCEIIWGGESYTLTPSNRLLRNIEKEVSLAHIAIEASKGCPPISHLAYVAAMLLQDAGADVTEDEMAAELQGGDHKDVVGFMEAIMAAITPQQVDEKKLGGRAPAAKPAAPKGKRRKA